MSSALNPYSLATPKMFKKFFACSCRLWAGSLCINNCSLIPIQKTKGNNRQAPECRNAVRPTVTATGSISSAPNVRIKAQGDGLEANEEGLSVKDCNGNPLEDGDSVTVIKDLKVEGSSLVSKDWTKVKNIRLVEGGHNIECKIDGIGAMKLKSEFVKTA